MSRFLRGIVRLQQSGRHICLDKITNLQNFIRVFGSHLEVLFLHFYNLWFFKFSNQNFLHFPESSQYSSHVHINNIQAIRLDIIFSSFTNITHIFLSPGTYGYVFTPFGTKALTQPLNSLLWRNQFFLCQLDCL